MYNFEKIVSLKSLAVLDASEKTNLIITRSNLNIRVRHLLYLFSMMYDLVSF
jgi:hypothetical protein